MKRVFFLCAALVISSLFIWKCSTIDHQGIIIPTEPFEKLSEYGFFKEDISALVPVEGVLPYDLNSPLFSDYSHKSRFVWMPEGTTAEFTTDHVLDFPVGAVLIKTFYYNHDETDLSEGRQLVETRLLINRGEEWDAFGYTWNDEQTDAVYDVVGDIKEISWINGTGEEIKVDYIIPNKNQCKGCHAYDNKLKPIGPKVRNLNKDFAYADGEMNQLHKWADLNYLSGLKRDGDHPAVAVWNDESNFSLQERSMAYLDINCGHCHNPLGAGHTSGLTLLADSEPGLKLGIYKATVSAGAGTGGHQYSIVPANPDESIMVFRMESNNPGAMMPEIGRRSVHTEGVQLIRDWIAMMDVTNYEDLLNQTL